MPKLVTIFRYVAIAIVVFVFIGLGWWYFFLRSQGSAIQAADAGRGIGTSAPSFGSAIGSTYNNIVSTITRTSSDSTSKKAQRLTEISKTPTAGFGFATVASSSVLRFVERSTGNVIDYDMSEGNLTRVSNTLVPRVYEALVARDGKIIDRTIDDSGEIQTFSATIQTDAGSSSPGTLVQNKLPPGIRSIAFDATGKELAYMLASNGGVGVRALWDGTKPKQIFSSGISGWQLTWLRDGRIVLVQHPTDGVTGYSYTVQPDGSLLPLASAAGLTLEPRTSPGAYLYGTSGTALSLFAKISPQTPAVSLPIKTTADKCVWSPGNQLIAFCAVPQRPAGPNFLDASHRGEVHTADSWWRVDASAGSAQILYSPGTAELDALNPMVDDGGTYIAFMNASDKSLWLLRLAE